jgi:DNA-binding FrmR family transcriptional regulator
MKRATKQRGLHRAKIIRGQVEGLISMIENEAYCTDILTQSLAIQRALRSLNKLIAEHHIQTHIAEGMSSGDFARQKRAQKELMDIYELSNIRGK